jgi:hypothetical protein
VPDELLAHISPVHSGNINFFGVINVDIEAGLAKLSGGWRPLRPPSSATWDCERAGGGCRRRG